MDPSDSFRYLSEEVEKAVKGRPVDHNAFLRLLRRHKLNFLNLLKYPPPSPEARRQLEIEKRVSVLGRVQHLNKQDVELAKQLSDQFNLNEITSVQLLISAHEERGSAEAPIAAGIFLEERKCLVAALHRLLQTQALDFEDDAGLVDMIVQYNMQILSEDVDGVSLVGRIISLVKAGASDSGDRDQALALVKDHRGRFVERAVLQQRELLWLCECLFYACTCLGGRISPADTRALLEAAQLMAQRWKSTADGDPTVPLQQAYVLHMALLQVLCPGDVGGRGEIGEDLTTAPAAGVKSLLSDTSLASGISSRGCGEGGFDAVVQLAWGLLLASDRRDSEAHGVLDGALRAGALSFLTYVVRSAPFLDDQSFHREAFASSLLSAVLSRLLALPVGRKLVQQLRDAPSINVPPALVTASGLYVRPVARTLSVDGAVPLGEQQVSYEDSIGTLLDALAEVCLVVPELHEQCEPLPAFMDFVAEGMRPGILVPYLHLLAALSTCPDGAQLVMQRLQAPPGTPPNIPIVGWETLLRGIHAYCTMFQPREGDDGPPVDVVMVEDDRTALEAYLLVLRRVLDGSTEAEAASWVASMQHSIGLHVLDLLFSLLCRPVAPSLRAALMGAVAAFVTSPVAASHVWDRLEQAGILLGGAASGASAGAGAFFDITYQLNEREAREQAYPETLAFVHLLNKLLGAGGLPDGGRPYARYSRFVRDSILVKGLQRGYKSTRERWELVHACLQHLVLLLEPFQPTEHAAASGAGTPAHELMLDILSDGSTFKAILAVLSLGTDHLEQDKRLGAEAAAAEEEAVLCALRVILLALERDGGMLASLRRNDVRVVYQPVESILRREPARLAGLLEYVRYQYNEAVRASALRLATELVDRVPQLVALVLQHPGGRDRIVEGYAACLEEALQNPALPAEEAADGAAAGVGRDTEAMAGRQGSGADAHSGSDCVALVMRLLLSSVEKPAPNMVHLLLGMDVEGAVERSVLDPVRSFTCLQVVLNVLSSTAMAAEWPQLFEQCLQLMYELCADPLTEGPTLELMRQPAWSVFWPQLKELGGNPLPAKELTSSGLDSNGPVRTASLCQRAWLMHLQGLSLHLSDMAVPAQREASMSLLHGLFVEPYSGGRGEQVQRPLMLEMLSMACYPMQEPTLGGGAEACRLMAELGLPDMLASPSLIVASERDGALLDVRALGEQLRAGYLRLEALYSTATGGGTRAALREAVHEGIRCAHELNQYREEMGAQQHMLRAWQELVEVALSRRYDLLEAVSSSSSGGGHAPLLYNLLEGVLEALQGLLSSEAASTQASALAPPLCEVVHTLMARLQEQARGPGVSCQIDVAGQRTMAGAGPLMLAPELLGRTRLPPGQCHALLAKLLACARSGERHEGVRRPLYGALLSYLHYCRSLRSADMPSPVLQALLRGGGDLHEAGGAVVGPGGRAYLDAMHEAQRSLEEGSVLHLQRASAQLVGALCRDALEGAELTRALALRVLDAMVGCEPQGGPLTEEVHKRDLPRACLAALASGPYEALLLPSAATARALHTVEAQLSLLLRLCRHDAKRLADLGAIPYLTSCRALSLQPEEAAAGMHPSSRLRGGLPSLRERHHQLVAPLLRLVVCLVSSLPNSSEVAQQAADFVETHHRMLLRVLSDRAPDVHEEDLEELDLTAALLSRLCASNVLPAPAPQLQAKLFQMAWHFLGLDEASPNKYVAALRDAMSIEAAGTAPEERARLEGIHRRVLSARCSLVRYIRALSSGEPGGLALNCFHAVSHRGQEPIGVPGGEGNAPTLKLLADTLQQACCGLYAAAEDRGHILNRMREVDEMPAGALEELILTYGTRPYAAHEAAALGQVGRRRVARAELARTWATRERDVSQQLLVVENVLAILETQLRGGAGWGGDKHGESAVDPSVGSPKEVEELRHALEPTLERLAQLQEGGVQRDIQYTHTLVRRMKSTLMR